jgi:hypothetical protein
LNNIIQSDFIIASVVFLSRAPASATLDMKLV